MGSSSRLHKDHPTVDEAVSAQDSNVRREEPHLLLLAHMPLPDRTNVLVKQAREARPVRPGFTRAKAAVSTRVQKINLRPEQGALSVVSWVTWLESAKSLVLQ